MSHVGASPPSRASAPRRPPRFDGLEGHSIYSRSAVILLGQLIRCAQSLYLADISLRAHYGLGGPIIGEHAFVYDGEPFDPKRCTMTGFAFSNLGVHMFGAQVIEVEVDEDTGQVVPTAAWLAHDVGRAINPLAVEGQIEGGFVQGLGYALWEELIWDSGCLSNPTMMDYKIPGTLDVPLAIEPIIVEERESSGPFGAKGVGE